MRERPEFIRELDFVAVRDGRLSEISCMPARRFSVTMERLLSGSDLWADQRPAGLSGQGIGKRLIETSKKLAADMGADVIIIYGDPDYYSKTGFVPAETYGVRNGGESVCGGASGLFAETGGRGIDKRPIFGRTGLRASAGDRSGVPGI